MRLFPYLLGFGLCYSPCFAQYEGDAWSNALGNAVTANPTHRSLFNNPVASIGDPLFFSAGYANTYFLPGIYLATAGMGFSIRSWSSSISLSSYGNKAFQLQQAGIGFARTWGNFSLGERFRVLQVDLGEYGKKSLLLVDIGFRYKLSESFFIASEVRNLSNAAVLKKEWIDPTEFRSGIAKRFSSQTLLCISLNKKQQEAIDLCTGLEYFPKKQFALQLGFQSKDRSIHLGNTLLLKQQQLQISYGLHPVLGSSMQTAYSYAF